MLNRIAFFRERDWREISAADYALCWQRYGGSVATHPAFVERLSHLAAIPARYLGWQRDGELVAAIPAWGRHLALSRAALKEKGKKRLFDLGNAEIILPAAPLPDGAILLRHSARYLSLRNKAAFSGLKTQEETLALLKAPDAFSAKFRYNQRRLVRQIETANGSIRSIRDFAPVELANFYLDLFRRRWSFAAAGAEHMAEVFTLLFDWMTGFVLFLDDAPIALQVLYRVESPGWVSVEYVNGGFDPALTSFSPGSALTYLNTKAAREEAGGKELRYSFGRFDLGYKALWCQPETVFTAG
ncbi:MAG: antimicrobial resistance protein Mig-14 [Betaproteobacteria bacterium]|nr:antimicrobial resistance protein Mig-14 [Betaproteobacteria bacterium]